MLKDRPTCDDTLVAKLISTPSLSAHRYNPPIHDQPRSSNETSVTRISSSHTTCQTAYHSHTSPPFASFDHSQLWCF